MRIAVTIWKSAAFGIISAGLLLAGCGRSSEDSVATKPPSEEIDARGFVSYPATDYISATKGHQGGTLHVATSTDTINLDPHGVSAVYVQWFGRLVFDNLVYQDAKGETQPWLAKSWTVSPDRLVYTFKLRDDVTFSDGAKFNAQAVLANLEHMRDPNTRSPLAGRYIVPYASGRIVDEYTFEATLSYPYTPFLDVLAQSWLAIISPKQIKEDPKGILSAPVGSGPYILESYQRQQSLKFVRRADYHWAPDYINHEGPAYIDRIEIEIISEALARYAGLSSGQFDLLLEAPAQNAAGIRANRDLVLDRRIRKGIPTHGITFNVEKAPFDDVRVRLAVAKAIDREAIVQVVGFGEFGAKSDLLAATTRYYDPSFRKVLSYDPVASNHLLDDAGWTSRDADGYRTKDGKRLGAELLVADAGTTPVSVTIATATQSDLKKVGFELRLVPIPRAQLTERRNKGDYSLINGGVWHTNTADALYILYDSDEIPDPPSRTGQNAGRLRDPIFDDLVAKARRSGDPTELQDLYSRAQKRIVELVPAVPLYENYSVISYNKRLHGVLFDTSHNTPVLTAAWLDPKS